LVFHVLYALLVSAMRTSLFANIIQDTALLLIIGFFLNFKKNNLLENHMFLST